MATLITSTQQIKILKQQIKDIEDNLALELLKKTGFNIGDEVCTQSNLELGILTGAKVSVNEDIVTLYAIISRVIMDKVEPNNLGNDVFEFKTYFKEDIEIVNLNTEQLYKHFKVKGK